MILSSREQTSAPTIQTELVFQYCPADPCSDSAIFLRLPLLFLLLQAFLSASLSVPLDQHFDGLPGTNG